MMNLEDFITSGILELYVLGHTSDEEDAEVLIMSSKFPAEIAHEILEIATALEYLALKNAVEPSAKLKESALAKFSGMPVNDPASQETDVAEKKSGAAAGRNGAAEKTTRPAIEIPRLNPFSRIEDYTDWFGPEDLITPEGFKGVHLKVLGHTAEMTTMIICATEIEGEIHHDIYERLLVLEGTCDVIIENKVFSFHRGDLIDIPLHKWHDVVIPEGTVCKAIQQRIPA